MPQTTAQDQSATPAFEGGLYDSGPSDKVTRSAGANVKQVDTILVTTVIAEVAQASLITITTAATADAFNVWIDGVLVATGTSSGTDKTVQRDALEVLLEANAYFAANFTWADSSTDAGTIAAIDPSRSFSIYIEIETTSAWDVTETTAFTPGTQFELTVDGHVVRYGAESTTEETESDAFLAVILANDAVSALVLAAEGTGTAITLTAVTAGTPFTAVLANQNESGQVGSGDISKSTTTATLTGSPVPFGRALSQTATANIVELPSATSFVLEGISIARAKGRPRDNTVTPPVTGDAQYREEEAINVLRKGRIWVKPEQAVTPESDVYIRHTQAVTAAHTVGRFRTDADTAKADQLSTARWITSASANELAVLEINVP